jgi:hypothetical protein
LFDITGKYLYYTEVSGEALSGPLYVYSTAAGNPSKIADNVSLYQSAGMPYAMADNGDAYRIEQDKTQKIGENAAYIQQTAGGDYILDNDGGISFLTDGKAEPQEISSTAQLLALPYSMEYCPPLEKDPYKALDVVIEYGYYYESVISGEDPGYQADMSLEEVTVLLEKLKGSQADEQLTEIFTQLYEGLTDFGKGEQYYSEAAQHLQNATDKYDSLSAGNEEEG